MTNLVIAEGAVETAAAALAKPTWPDWSLVPHFDQCLYRHHARVALTAGAPALMAQAWDEGERVGYEDSFRDNDPKPRRNPYAALRDAPHATGEGK